MRHGDVRSYREVAYSGVALEFNLQGSRWASGMVMVKVPGPLCVATRPWCLYLPGGRQAPRSLFITILSIVPASRTANVYQRHGLCRPSRRRRCYCHYLADGQAPWERQPIQTHHPEWSDIGNHMHSKRLGLGLKVECSTLRRSFRKASASTVLTMSLALWPGKIVTVRN